MSALEKGHGEVSTGPSQDQETFNIAGNYSPQGRTQTRQEQKKEKVLSYKSNWNKRDAMDGRKGKNGSGGLSWSVFVGFVGGAFCELSFPGVGFFNAPDGSIKKKKGASF